MLKKNIYILIIIYILLNKAPLLAEINTTVNFQGMLTDSQNVAVVEGTYTLTFSLWDGEDTNSNKLWEEPHTIFISRGIYSVMLGSIIPFPYTLTFAEPYYLGVQVNNEPEYLTSNGKLVPLVSTWSSFRAKTCGGKLVRSVNENYTVTTTDDFIMVSGNTIVKLPKASSVKGRIFTFKKMDINNEVVIQPQINEFIDSNAQSITLTEQFDEIEFISTGENWLIIGFPATAIRKIEDAINTKANSIDVYTRTTIDNTINSTVTDITNTLQQKAYSIDVYTRTYIDNTINSAITDITNTLQQKAYLVDVYTRTYIDNTINAAITDITNTLQQKAYSIDVYTRTYIDNTINAAITDITNTLQQKAFSNDVYSKSYLDNALLLKADSEDIYTRQYIDDALTIIAVGGDLTSSSTFAKYENVYTRTYLDEKLSALEWNEITADSYTMTANNSYLINNTNTTVLNMPDSNDLNIGDIINISAIGTGGWQIAQQSGQSIQLGNKVIYRESEPGEIWRERSLVGSLDWSCIDMSSDGRFIVAGVSFGNIYLSQNYGETWTSYAFNPSKDWVGISISDDGQTISAAPTLSYIVTTTDAGSTWITQTTGGERMWRDLAGSSTADKLIACVGGSSGDRFIYTSEDNGGTWTEQMDAGSNNWIAVAASSDFTKAAACVGGTSGDRYIYTSSDGGYVWKKRTNSTSQNWKDIVMSSDGNIIAAVVYGGYIYISTDFGLNWTEITSAGNRYWESIAMSGDANTIVATYDGGIYKSSNQGAAWAALTVDSLNYKSIDISTEATIYATAIAGSSGDRYIYTSQSESTAITQIDDSTATAFSGTQYESASLQYIGNNTFTLLESDNTSTLNFKNGNVGIGTSEPETALHVKDILKIEPRISVPENPSAGEIYFDATTNKLKVYDGNTWQACW